MFSKNITFHFFLLGFLFGLFFPVIAFFLNSYFYNLPFSLSTFVELHRNYPIHYIVDTAPLFLSFAAYTAGKHVDKLHKADRLKIEEQFVELQNKNEELTAIEEEMRQNNEELVSLNELIYEQKQELSMIIENQGEGFALVDFEGNFLFFNPAACRILDLPDNDLSAFNLKDFFDNEQWAKIVSNIEERKKGRKSNYEIECKTYTAVKKYISITGSPYYNKENVIVGSIIVFRDISKLKTTEIEILTKNEELNKYFTAIEQTYATVVITNVDGFIEYANPRFEFTTGYSCTEVLGKTPSVLKSGKTPEQTYVDLWDTITKGNVWHGEFINVKKDKTEYIEKVTISPICNEQGKITHYMAIKEDISELKKAENALREINRQQQILINNIPAHIYFKNIRGEYILANDSYAAEMNYRVADIIGKTDYELIDKKAADFFCNLDNDVLQLNEPIYDYEYEIQCADGSNRWSLISKVPISDNENNVTGIIGIVTDFTQYKIFEQTITEKTRQFENTVANLQDIYFKTDIGGNLLQASPSICEIFCEDSLKNIINNKLFDVFYGADTNKRDFIANVISAGKLNNHAFKIKSCAEQTFYFDAKAVVWFDVDNQPKGIEGIIRNITERVEFEKELNRLNFDLTKTLEITHEQKIIIERAHKNITDSISYAKTIQTDFLVRPELLNTFFDEHLLIFKPKDIVSGDFYFIEKVENKLIVAVADCTGHGVPGAFMTILSMVYLRDIISHGAVDDAGRMLNLLRQDVKKSFRNSEKENRNGLDIALCIIDTDTNMMQYAGAFNPILMIRDGQFHEYTATRNPIGFYIKELDFETKNIQLFNNDLIYLFSDGYYDQFGGEDIRKFTKKRFKELISCIKEKPLAIQQQILENNLIAWQGKMEQTDDITVFAFKWTC